MIQGSRTSIVQLLYDYIAKGHARKLSPEEAA